MAPWSRVFLGNLIGRQLLKKFPAFYETRMFITAFTRTRHLCPSRSRSSQSISLSHFLKMHFNIILPSTLRSSRCFLSLRFTHKPLYAHPVLHICQCPISLLLLDLITQITFCEEYKP
jgi:hypothetical protein